MCEKKWSVGAVVFDREANRANISLAHGARDRCGRVGAPSCPRPTKHQAASSALSREPDRGHRRSGVAPDRRRRVDSRNSSERGYTSVRSLSRSCILDLVNNHTRAGPGELCAANCHTWHSGVDTSRVGWCGDVRPSLGSQDATSCQGESPLGAACSAITSSGAGLRPGYGQCRRPLLHTQYLPLW